MGRKSKQDKHLDELTNRLLTGEIENGDLREAAIAIFFFRKLCEDQEKRLGALE